MNRLLFLLRTRSQLTCGRVQTQSLKQCSSTSTPKLPDHVLHLTCPSFAKSRLSNVYVIGTNHVSRKSCEEVRALINSVRPEVVFLELCENRQDALEDQKIPTMKEIMTAAWRSRSIGMLKLCYGLHMELNAKALKVVPGSEFRVAYEEAIKHGASVVIGDRPAEITLTRARRNVTVREIASFCTMFWFFRHGARLLYEAITKLFKGRDSELFQDMKIRIFQEELSKTIPSITEAFVNERDLIMSHGILTVAKAHSCVVAVVGKGHLPGIKKHWKQPVSVEDLFNIPPHAKTATSTIILTIILTTIIFYACISKINRYILEKVFSKKSEEREALNKRKGE